MRRTAFGRLTHEPQDEIVSLPNGAIDLHLDLTSMS